jgi:hypothetical protein
MPEENAPSRRYFSAASLERRSRRRNPTRTYVEIAISSRPMKMSTISKPAAMHIMPTTENSIRA